MEEYPLKIVLSDNSEVRIKEIDERDKSGIEQFLKKIPLADFLIYKDEESNSQHPLNWFLDKDKKKLFEIISVFENDVIGIGTLHREGIYWQDSAELKLFVDPCKRGKGLGSIMFNLLLARGLKLKIKKIIVRYMADNQYFLKMLVKYDFQPESFLNMYVLDDDRHFRDMIIASLNLDEWNRRFQYYSIYLNTQLK